MKIRIIVFYFCCSIILQDCGTDSPFGNKKKDDSVRNIGLVALVLSLKPPTVILNGSKVVPSVTTSGTGTYSATYNTSTKTLNCNFTWTNLSSAVTAVHLHGPASVSQNAAIQIFTTPSGTLGTSGSSSGSVTLSASQETDLLAGNWYIDIHTSTFTNGEIRGQLAVATTSNPSSGGTSGGGTTGGGY